MKKILQIKSGELQRYKKVNAILKTASIDCYEQHSLFMKRQTLGEHCQDHYRIANAVKEILQMKPSTAERRHSKHSSTRGKIELLSMARANDRQVSINKERQRDNNEEGTGRSKEKLGCIFLQIDKRLRSKIKSSKSSRVIRREYDFEQSQQNRHRMESIQAKKTVCFKDQEGRQNIEEKEWRVSTKKTKKENYLTKIPDFIKASLESYECLTKPKQKQTNQRKEQKTEEEEIEDLTAEKTKMPEIRIPELAVVTNKKELKRKTKRRENTGRQQEKEGKGEVSVQERYMSKAKVQNPKKSNNKIIGESMEICGWNEQDD